VFEMREYSCFDSLTDVRLVIDCGANVGYTSAYFLSRFPSCHVIAVEPDPENVRILRRNLSAYGDRVTIVPSAVWSHPTALRISDVPYRDGREWARQVQECAPSEEGAFVATDIGGLLAAAPHDAISILKVDVEGAECVVFAGNTDAWLPVVENIAIELHDDSSFGSATDVVFRAVSGMPFDVSTSGELTVFSRRDTPRV
jgi:FkbM family methyltransferase